MSKAKKITTTSFEDQLALSTEQVLFCQEYLKDLSILRAARAVNVTYETGQRWLAKDAAVKTYVKTMMAERAQRTKVDSDAVLVELAAMMNADVMDIRDDKGKWKPLSEWPLVWRKMVSQIKEGKDGELTYKFVDRLKVIELLGDHIDVNAFGEKEHSESGLAARLQAARRRVLQEHYDDIEKSVVGEMKTHLKGKDVTPVAVTVPGPADL